MIQPTRAEIFRQTQIKDLDCRLTSIPDLSTYGLTVVNNTPEDGLKALVKVIGFHRNTHYGEEFEVSSKDDANNLAYSTRDLGLRQDLTFYLNKPGVSAVLWMKINLKEPKTCWLQIQFLQCVRQEDDQSGENQFCDGFMVEKLFKEKYPEQWKILTDVRIGWHDEGVDCYGEFCKDHQAPVFEWVMSHLYCTVRTIYFARFNFFSAPVGCIKKLRPLYYIKPTISLLLSHSSGL